MDNPNPTPRVITFSGPKEGVGKTSVCLNLALAWANYQKRNVLIIPLDPMCRQEQAMTLGLTPPSMAEMVQTRAESIGALGALIRGRSYFALRVGVLPLAKRSDVARMSRT